MLDFRRRSRLRKLSRREEGRLLVLVLAAGAIILLASQAMRIAQFASPVPAGYPARSQPGRAPAGDPAPRESLLAVDRRLLEGVEDDAPFRAAEHDAWFHLLGVLKNASPAALDREAARAPTYVELDRQPREYRGELVKIAGIARRAEVTRAPANSLGIDRYYRLVITPDDSPDNVLFVYVLDLPPSFPRGLKINERVDFVGFSFKRWLYSAQDRVRPAPVLLARSIRWIPAAPTARRPSVSPIVLLPVGLLVAGAISLLIWLRTRRSAQRSGSPPKSFILPASLWAVALAVAEAASGAELPDRAEPLRLMGIEPAELEALVDGAEWQETENELLYNVFFRLREFGPGDLDRWAAEPLPQADLRSEAALEGRFYRLRGRVTRVEPMATSPAVAARFELPEYFRCRMALEGDHRECVVFARAVPSAWEQGVDIDQPAGAAGLLLKFGETADGRSEPFFAAARMAWFPDTPLGRLGMDVGLLDDLRPEESGPADGDFAALAGSHLDRFRLTTRNREAFYQMLAAASRAAPEQLEEWAAAERTGGASDSVVKLFNDPLSQQGRLVTLAGQAREITEVRVGDDDIRQRFGLDRYYVVFLFTPDSQDNPLAFCTRQLPAGLSPGGGPRFNEPVRVTGFFFNTWAYRSRETEAAGRAKWQLAPLIIGGTPIREPPPAAAPRLLGPRGWLAAAALIAAAAWVAWRLRVRRPASGDPERPAPDFSSLG